MISGTKRLSNETHVAVWNANILTKTHSKVWYGDLNLTTEGSKLKQVAKIVGEPLYVLHESGCRFSTEGLPWDSYKEKAVWDTTKHIPKNMKT